VVFEAIDSGKVFQVDAGLRVRQCSLCPVVCTLYVFRPMLCKSASTAAPHLGSKNLGHVELLLGPIVMTTIGFGYLTQVKTLLPVCGKPHFERLLLEQFQEWSALVSEVPDRRPLDVFGQEMQLPHQFVLPGLHLRLIE
jgi:hypothetical protein